MNQTIQIEIPPACYFSNIYEADRELGTTQIYHLFPALAVGRSNGPVRDDEIYLICILSFFIMQWTQVILHYE